MGKLYGKYRGQVEANVDPLRLGRVRVSSAAALGDGVVKWAMPCVPSAAPGVGFTMLPPVGASVWVEFEGGDPDYPIWSGCFWAEGTTLEADSGDVIVSGHDGTIVKLDAAGNVKVSARTLEVLVGTMTLEAGVLTASGVVRCDTLIANNVVASSYTPGAGNVE
jgi:hypothetical protein